MRNTYFSNVLKSNSFLYIAVLAFGISTLLFGNWGFLPIPGDVSRLWTPDFLWLNLTTAFARLSYFSALLHLEPATVNIIYVGVGPLTVLFWLSKSDRIDRFAVLEKKGYTGVALSKLGVMAVTIAGRSSLGGGVSLSAIAALVLVALGGVLIAVSHMIARRSNDAGLGTGMVFGSWFLLTVVLAIAGEAAFGIAEMRLDAETLPSIAARVFVLIVLPSFALQLEITRSPPLAVNIIRAHGPAFVFTAQEFENPLTFSGLNLVCIALLSVSAGVASGLRTSDGLRGRS